MSERDSKRARTEGKEKIHDLKTASIIPQAFTLKFGSDVICVACQGLLFCRQCGEAIANALPRFSFQIVGFITSFLFWLLPEAKDTKEPAFLGRFLPHDNMLNGVCYALACVPDSDELWVSTSCTTQIYTVTPGLEPKMIGQIPPRERLPEPVSIACLAGQMVVVRRSCSKDLEIYDHRGAHIRDQQYQQQFIGCITTYRNRLYVAESRGIFAFDAENLTVPVQEFVQTRNRALIPEAMVVNQSNEIIIATVESISVYPGNRVIAPHFYCRGLALDREGNLYATDNIHGNVRVYNSQGVLLTTFYNENKHYHYSATLLYPEGISVDCWNRIFVANNLGVAIFGFV